MKAHSPRKPFVKPPKQPFMKTPRKPSVKTPRKHFVKTVTPQENLLQKTLEKLL